MLNRIEIKNFRGLSALDLELAQTTVLVGPNSCGKTSVLHGVQLACAAVSFAVARHKLNVADNGWLALYDDKPLRDDQSFLPTSRWHELFSDANTEHDIEIVLHFSPEHAIERLLVKLHAGRAEALRMTVKLRIADEHPLLDLIEASVGRRGRRARTSQAPGETASHLGLFDQLSDQFPRAIFIPAFYGVVREEEFRARGAVEALLQGGQQGHVVRNLLMRLPNLEGLNAFLPLAGLHAKVERCTSLQETETVRHLEVLFRDRNGRLELSSAGTGLASLLALYAAIQLYQSARAEGRAVIFMLDEPEAHLHPRLQGEVAVKLTEMVTAAGNQLLCATHSVEMINRFGRDPRVTVLRIDRQQAGPPRALRSEDDLMDELSAWCDLSPFAQLNLLATRRILFFEGTSDRKILAACARLYLGSDPMRLKRFEDFTPAPLSGTGNLHAKEVLKRALLPVFQQLPQSELIRVVRILDRDYSRLPKLEAQRDNAAHYEELEVIWSRHSIESLFLEPECLADWLDAALKVPERPAALDRGALLLLAKKAIEAADSDPELHQAAVEQLAPRLVQGRTNQDITEAIQEAHQKVKNEPAIYQRGHDRDHFVLGHIRQALLSDPQTKRLANRVRRDVAQLVSESLLGPNLLLPPALIPPEIKQVLDFMAAS
jgi:hypothetical protein